MLVVNAEQCVTHMYIDSVQPACLLGLILLVRYHLPVPVLKSRHTMSDDMFGMTQAPENRVSTKAKTPAPPVPAAKAVKVTKSKSAAQVWLLHCTLPCGNLFVSSQSIKLLLGLNS